MKNSRTVDNLLKKLYYNLDSPSSFSSVKRLFNAAKKQNKKITRQNVKDFLSEQNTYTLHKDRRKRFERNITKAAGLDTHWQIDLADMQKIRKFNDNHGYILTCVDVLSRFFWGIPIRYKKPELVAKAFETILKVSK